MDMYTGLLTWVRVRVKVRVRIRVRVSQTHGYVCGSVDLLRHIVLC